MSETNKLFKVSLVGLTDSTGIKCNPSFVIAKDAGEAYKKVKDSLDNKDYGFSKDRELKSVELIAEEKEYASCGAMLFL